MERADRVASQVGAFLSDAPDDLLRLSGPAGDLVRIIKAHVTGDPMVGDEDRIVEEPDPGLLPLADQEILNALRSASGDVLEFSKDVFDPGRRVLKAIHRKYIPE